MLFLWSIAKLSPVCQQPLKPYQTMQQPVTINLTLLGHAFHESHYVEHGTHGRVGRRVGDEDVDAAELLHGFADQRLAVFGAADVAREANDPRIRGIDVCLPPKNEQILCKLRNFAEMTFAEIKKAVSLKSNL